MLCLQMVYSVRFRHILCIFILFNVVQSATLVDSDDNTEAPPQTTPSTIIETQKDADLSKLLLMKKLLSIRSHARALSTTFSSQRASSDIKDHKIEAADLHTAYRLPLHRLSDTQLRLLLQKYAEKDIDGKMLTRMEMIEKLKELITKDDDKMLRPRLLTNINVMNPSDLALNQPVVRQDEIERTTVGPIPARETFEPLYETTPQSFLINSDDSEPSTYGAKLIQTTEIPSTSEQPEIPSIEQVTPESTLEQTEIPSTEQFTPESTSEQTEIPSTEQVTPESTPEQTEIPSTESTIPQTDPTTTQAHKQIPMGEETNQHLHTENNESDSYMHQKNNRLHSQYIASLSEDLQRLKAKYDLMKLEFLRTLRRINERNVNKAQLNKLTQAAAPTFVISDKDKSEPIDDSKNPIEINKQTTIQTTIGSSESIELITNEPTTIESTNESTVESTNDPTNEPTTNEFTSESTIESTTKTIQNGTEKAIGAEKIEAELLANREFAKSSKKAEEVTPSHLTSEIPQEAAEQQNVVNFFKSDESSAELNKTTTEVPSTTLKIIEEVTQSETTPKSYLIDSDQTDATSTSTTQMPKSKIIHELEKLIDHSGSVKHIVSNGIYQRISTVELEKLDNKTPRKLVETTTEAQTPTTLSSSEGTTTNEATSETTLKPISMMEAVNKFESELMSPKIWKEEGEHQAVKALENQTTLIMQPKIQVKLKRIDDLVTAADLIDKLQAEAKDSPSQPFEPIEKQSCRKVTCDFEQGKLCKWQSSRDSLSNRRYLISNRHRRQNGYATRSWQIRKGKEANGNETIDKSDWFSSTNQQFIATYLKPQQKSILTADVSHVNNQEIIFNFQVWEATRNMQLKMCCDNINSCVFETDLGLKRGTRRWLNREASCPIGTKRVLFECSNHGSYQGACGIDNIELAEEECPSKQNLFN